jgi:gliding motility-associated-like protein
LYKDFATPAEVQKVDYSFASASRVSGAGTTVELWAGPPSGPFVMLTDHTSSTLVWSLRTGTYTVPVGQTTTRFIFRVRGNGIGHLLDAANFKVNTNIVTPNTTLACSQNSINVEAVGVGQWSADASNPVATIIGTPTSTLTSISGLDVPGTYVYHWITRYCDKTITITRQGVNIVPTVTTPITYCTNEVAVPLTAIVPSGYTLMWYTQAVGGIGSATAPTPNTTIAGSTMYYVSAVDSNGCTGARTSIEVVVNQVVIPIVGFTYDNAMYCKNDPNPVITLDPNFTPGGSFTAQPNGLSIDPTTGDINLLGSIGGIYTVTYEIQQNGCSNAGSNSVSLTVDGSCVDIPRGISPNNDGLNDAFDLTGLDVKEVVIFNRYGTKVYSFEGNYTNQWIGQSNGGDKLPDGTYFYSIQKENGTTVTGWVYINR